MSKPKPKRNKKYYPKPARTNPLEWAIAGVHTFPHATVAELMAAPLASFDKLRQGAADRDDWNMVAQPLNVARALADLNIGANLMPAVIAGHQALEQIALRMQDKGTSTCRMAELEAIREALTMHEAQLRVCTQAEYSRALHKVKDTIRSGGSVKMEKLYEAMKEAA